MPHAYPPRPLNSQLLVYLSLSYFLWLPPSSPPPWFELPEACRKEQMIAVLWFYKRRGVGRRERERMKRKTEGRRRGGSLGRKQTWKKSAERWRRKRKEWNGKSYHRKQREQLCSGGAAGWRSAPQRGRSKLLKLLALRQRLRPADYLSPDGLFKTLCGIETMWKMTWLSKHLYRRMFWRTTAPLLALLPE